MAQFYVAMLPRMVWDSKEPPFWIKGGPAGSMQNPAWLEWERNQKRVQDGWYPSGSQQSHVVGYSQPGRACQQQGGKKLFQPGGDRYLIQVDTNDYIRHDADAQAQYEHAEAQMLKWTERAETLKAKLSGTT